jgi:hypothetical protein
MFLFPRVKETLTSYVLSDGVADVDIVTTDDAFGHRGPITVSLFASDTSLRLTLFEATTIWTKAWRTDQACLQAVLKQ